MRALKLPRVVPPPPKPPPPEPAPIEPPAVRSCRESNNCRLGERCVFKNGQGSCQQPKRWQP